MKKIFLIFSAAIAFTSCETELLPNDTLVVETVYTDVSDLERGLNGVMATYNPYPVINFNSIFTDECKIGKDSGGQEVTKYNMQLTAAVNGNDIWIAHYRTINFANKLIAASAQITPVNASEVTRKNNVLGQMYALRALCHLDLMAHYATTMADPAAPGVIYLDYVPGVFDEPARNTVGDCFSKMSQDLDTAESLMTGASDKIKLNKEAITFLRAKIALFTGDNNGAITHADTLIGLFSLATTAQYVNMFIDTDNTEVIFKAERKNTNAFIGGTWYFTGTGGAFLEMSNSMYNSMDTEKLDNSVFLSPYLDVRTEVLFDRVGSGETGPDDNFHLIGKYPGSEGFLFMNDVKVMRLSEIYLIKAEAQAKLSQFGAAASTMQTLVDTRYGAAQPTITYANLNEAITDILAERKIELGYEGHRYVDIKRLRSITNTGIVRNSLDCGGAAPCDLPVSDDRFTLPIPLIEINANGSATQNPGY